MRTKRDPEGDYVLVILCAVLISAVKADDLYLCLALCNGAPSFFEDGMRARWVELRKGRAWESVFDLDAYVDGNGCEIVLLLLLLFEGESHHAPGDVFHSLCVREVGFGAGKHLPDLSCKGILLC